MSEYIPTATRTILPIPSRTVNLDIFIRRIFQLWAYIEVERGAGQTYGGSGAYRPLWIRLGDVPPLPVCGSGWDTILASQRTTGGGIVGNIWDIVVVVVLVGVLFLWAGVYMCGS